MLWGRIAPDLGVRQKERGSLRGRKRVVKEENRNGLEDIYIQREIGLSF